MTLAETYSPTGEWPASAQYLTTTDPKTFDTLGFMQYTNFLFKGFFFQYGSLFQRGVILFS